jgi:proteasome accessory factor B
MDRTGRRRAARHLLALARALVAGRAVRLRFREAGGGEAERVAAVAALGFDGERWRVAAACAAPEALRVLDLARVLRVRASARAAGRVPAGFDAHDFALRHLLDPAAGPLRPVALALPAALVPLAPALLPGARLAPGRRGWTALLRTSRPEVARALAHSLPARAGIDSSSRMARRPRTAATPEARRLRLAAWLLAQTEPVTRGQIYEALPDDYDPGDGEGPRAAAAERKFTRDKDALRRLGFAIDKVDLGSRDDAVGYVLDARACALPAIDFGDDEAAAVWTAGVGAARFSDHPLREELESALRKLLVGAKGLPPRAAAAAELAGAPYPAPGALLARLIEAWERRKRITVDYHRVKTGETVRRTVDVYGWAGRRGEWIFAGHDSLRNEVRVFYLSRVRSLTVNGRRAQDPDYDVPAGFDIRRWSRQEIWDYDVHPPRAAAVRLRGGLARLARQLLPGARVETDATGARLARLEVRNLRGLVRQALAWGPEAELVEPEEGRALAREILAGVAARPTPGTSPGEDAP